MKPIILGTAALSGQPYAGKTVSRKDARAVVARAVEYKIMHYDTSPAYGFAEDVLGDVLTGLDSTIYSKHAAVATVLPSVRKLSRCTVKLLAHNLDPAIMNSKDGWQKMPVWSDGYSAYAKDDRRVLYEWRLSYEMQFDCSIISRDASEGAMPFMARSVFARGMLCGGTVPPEIAGAVKAAKEVADSLGLPLPALALHWALQQPKITGVVIGPSSVAELDQIMAWSKLPCQDIGKLANLIPSVSVDLRTWK